MLTPLLPLLFSLPAAAQGAEVTELPTWLRGDVSLAYDADVTIGTMNELLGGESANVARFTTEDHVLRLGGVFAPAPALALYFEVPIYLRSAVTFTESREMAYDPLEDRGSMVYGDSVGDRLETAGSGPGGVWLGLRGTPFTEHFWPGRGNRSTWLIDVGFKTADSSSFYVVTDDLRGGGPGAGAFRLRNAFSTTKGLSRPYIQATWTRYGTQIVDLTDSAGQVVTAGAEISPPDRFDVLAGVQVRAFENQTSGAAFDFDFRLGVDYNTPGAVPSGLYLPSVLNATQGTLVNTGEYSTASAGMGLYWRMFTYVQLNISTDVAYVMPHRVEHPYSIYTGEDTLAIRGLAELKVRIR